MNVKMEEKINHDRFSLFDVSEGAVFEFNP